LAPRFRETMLVNIGTAFLMPTSRIKPALKVANKPPAKNAEATVRLAKPRGLSIRKKAGQDAVKASSTAKNKAAEKKPTRARRRARPSQKAAGGIYQLDLSAFFPESVERPTVSGRIFTTNRMDSPTCSLASRSRASTGVDLIRIGPTLYKILVLGAVSW
jgi:hypothetical protein